ncbi:hypothetical protein [Metabacillus fastidiosus]
MRTKRKDEEEMEKTQDLHKTNEEVEETGKYVCAAGEVKELQKGEKFPNCPKSDKPTTWRHTDHVHKTGEQVTESGQYVNEGGVHVDLKEGDTFPSCPKSGKSVTWKHSGHTHH